LQESGKAFIGKSLTFSGMLQKMKKNKYFILSLFNKIGIRSIVDGLIPLNFGN